MTDNNTIKNHFRLVGKVHAKRQLEYGMSNGIEWHKLEILLAITPDKQFKTYYYPIIFWNQRAESANTHIKENDFVAIEGQIVTKEYFSKRDNSLNYFINLTAYKYDVIAQATTNNNINNTAQNIIEDNSDYDEVPF